MTGLERPPATADVDALVDLLVEVAQAGLRREGTFGPVAAVIDSAGNPRLLSATPDATWRSTEVADALQARGLVERTPDPTDRRAVVLTPTAAGRRVQEEVAAARAADTRDLFARLGPADREALRRILRSLAED